MTKPVCKLIGTDGNVFSIIGRVSRELRKAGLDKQADDFQHHALRCPSYSDVLVLCEKYVEIT